MKYYSNKVVPETPVKMNKHKTKIHRIKKKFKVG